MVIFISFIIIIKFAFHAKEKNDTLAGLVTEYKAYKKANKEIIASLQSATTELGDTKLSLKESQAVIGFKGQEIVRINKNDEEALIVKVANYNKEIENIIKQHDQELRSIKGVVTAKRENSPY